MYTKSNGERIKFFYSTLIEIKIVKDFELAYPNWKVRARMQIRRQKREGEVEQAQSPKFEKLKGSRVKLSNTNKNR